MVDTRNTQVKESAEKVEKPVRHIRGPTSATLDGSSMRYIKDLRLTFPDLSVPEAVQLLKETNSDIQHAKKVHQERQTRERQEQARDCCQQAEEEERSVKDMEREVMDAEGSAKANLSQTTFKFSTPQGPKGHNNFTLVNNGSYYLKRKVSTTLQGEIGHYNIAPVDNGGHPCKRKEGERGYNQIGPVNNGGNQVKRKISSVADPDQEMVTITVGKENPKKYSAHKNMICDVSPYFEAVFNDISGPSVKNKINDIIIDFAIPEVMELFINWIYYKKVMDNNKQIPSSNNLAQLWVFGAKVQAPPLQNQVIRALFNKCFCTNPSDFRWLYENTVPNDPLRRLFIDLVVSRKMTIATLKGILEVHWNQIPPEMAKDVILGLKRLTGPPHRAEMPPLKFENYLVPEPDL